MIGWVNQRHPAELSLLHFQLQRLLHPSVVHVLSWPHIAWLHSSVSATSAPACTRRMKRLGVWRSVPRGGSGIAFSFVVPCR